MAPTVGRNENASMVFAAATSPALVSPALVLLALGNYQGYVVGLLVRAELLKIVNKGSNQDRRRLLTMPSQRFN